MNESAAVAHRIASRLGSDLDRILPLPTNRSTTDDRDADMLEVGCTIQLRQIGGLTSGAAMNLTPGCYEFGETAHGHGGLDGGQPDAAAFRLTVHDDGRVELTPDTGGVRLDGELVSETTEVGTAIIDVGSARFRVSRPRTPKRRRSVETTVAPQLHDVMISVPTIEQAEAECERLAPNGPPGRSRWPFAGRRRGGDDGIHHGFDALTDEVVRRVLVAREDLLSQRWAAHPDPEELQYWAQQGAPLAWSRPIDHWHFAHIAIAIGDLPWRPRFDRPHEIPAATSEKVRALHSLPSAPVTADLRVGPLGIVGDRAAVLSAARHVMIALATTSSPQDLEIAVLADADRANDWVWADQLPHTVGTPGVAMPILVADGMSQLDRQGIGTALTEPGGVGAVLLTDDIAALPPICATVMLVNDDGTAVIMDHRGGSTTPDATPLGLSADLASTAAERLRAHAPIEI